METSTTFGTSRASVIAWYGDMQGKEGNTPNTNVYITIRREEKARKGKGGELIPIASVSDSSLEVSSESEIIVFTTGL